MKNISKQITAGSVMIGGGSPIIVQTMWDRPLKTAGSEVRESLELLKKIGCGMIRFAVPDGAAVPQVGKIAAWNILPIVADIHFDYRLAMDIMDFPVAKIRINPGNIGDAWKVGEIVKKADDRNIALRVGANSGSLPSRYRQGKNTAEAMVAAVAEQLEILEKHRFGNTVVSLKSSDMGITVEANRLFRQKSDYPLHIGVTEAGPVIPAVVKSTLALSELLRDGIGDTLRVSISDDPALEIMAARELLSALKIGPDNKVEIISCPRCGRTEFDTHEFTRSVLTDLYAIEKPLKIAIMGCPVNGPGEAREADLGITGSGDTVFIFRNGHVVRKEKVCDARFAFLEELKSLC